jgi:hypothetical protein
MSFGAYQGHGNRRSLMGGRTLVASGDDLSRAICGAVDLVGAGAATADQAKAAIMDAISARGAAIVHDTDPNKARRFPLGFATTTVTAATVATLSTQPQILFRPERLVIPSDFAGAFTVTSIIVGQASQLAAQAPLPARTYTEFGVGVDMHLDTADISQFVQLGLSNNSLHDVAFNGQFIGLVAL